MSYRRYSGFLSVLLSTFFLGCASWKEPEATADATPPAGYAPLYVKSVAPMPEKKPQKSAINATRVDTRDGKMVRIYVHVLDSNGTYYTGGVKGNGKALWCKVTEPDKEPMSVAIVMDNSGSIGDAHARSMQSAVLGFLSLKQPQDGLALVRYDNHAT